MELLLEIPPTNLNSDFQTVAFQRIKANYNYNQTRTHDTFCVKENEMANDIFFL